MHAYSLIDLLKYSNVVVVISLVRYIRILRVFTSATPKYPEEYTTALRTYLIPVKKITIPYFNKKYIFSLVSSNFSDGELHRLTLLLSQSYLSLSTISIVLQRQDKSASNLKTIVRKNNLGELVILSECQMRFRKKNTQLRLEVW